MPELFDYERVAGVAQRLVTRFANNRTVTFKTDSTVPIDPERPWAGVHQLTTPEIPALFSEFDSRLVASGAVQQDDKRLVVAALDLGDLTPTMDWVCVDGGEDYRVVSIDNKTNNARIVWVLGLRR